MLFGIAVIANVTSLRQIPLETGFEWI